MKRKIIFLGILLTSLIVLGGGILNKKEILEQLEDNKNIELAIYINNEQTSSIPSKDSGYIFDEQNSSCTNNADLLWDYETWSPVVKNMNEYKTKCTLAFRNYYLITVITNGDAQNYQVSLNDSSIIISANMNYTLLRCNQGVEMVNNDANIQITNVQSDVLCVYYENSADAVEKMDTSKNYIIYFQDEILSDNLEIAVGKDLVMDLNGHLISGPHGILNYSNLTILSSANEYGRINSSGFGSLLSYRDSILKLNNVEVSSNTSTVGIYDQTILQIQNSRLLSVDDPAQNSSTVWIHGGKTSLSVVNSYIKGPFAIGGEGGKILLDSSELVGYLHSGLQVNSGYSGNVILQNNSTISGIKNAINMPDGSLTLGNSINDSVLIRGNVGLNVGYGTSSFEINYNAGDIYGTIDLNAYGKINVISGKTMCSVEEDGVMHTYLQ